MHDSLQYFTRRSAEGIIVPVIQAMVACYEKYHRACFLLPLLSLGSAVFVGSHNDILYAALLRVAELTVNWMKNGTPSYIRSCVVVCFGSLTRFPTADAANAGDSVLLFLRVFLQFYQYNLQALPPMLLQPAFAMAVHALLFYKVFPLASF